MAKTIETIINRFDGGMQNDLRERINGACKICKNFDVYTNPHKMKAFAGVEDGDSSADTYDPQNFAVAPDGTVSEGSSYKLYSLGHTSGGTKAFIRYKNISCCAATDLGGSSWSTLGTTAKHSGSVEDIAYGLFTYYGKTGLIYCASTAGNEILAYDPDGIDDFLETGVNAVTMSSIYEGLVHSKDDILYIPYYYDGAGVAENAVSAIMSFDGTTWNDTAITLPNHLKPQSICEYGNYLAIAATPASGIGKTWVYLWNRDGSLTTVSESIEWGSGDLKIIEEIEGYLIGISVYAGATRRVNDRAIFRAYNGGTPQTFLTLESDINDLDIPSARQKIDERLLFQMQYEDGGTVNAGIFAVGIKNGRPVVVQESITDDAANGIDELSYTAATFGQKGFIKLGDIIFQSYTNDGSTYVMSKTDDQTNGNQSAIFQTNINPNMSAQYMSVKKQLVAASVSFEPLVDENVVKLEYRVDAGSWVTIFTHTADAGGSPTNVGDIIKEAKVDTNGATFEEGYEYEFRITATNWQPVITEFKYKVELMGTIV